MGHISAPECLLKTVRVSIYISLEWNYLLWMGDCMWITEGTTMKLIHSRLPIAGLAFCASVYWWGKPEYAGRSYKLCYSYASYIIVQAGMQYYNMEPSGSGDIPEQQPESHRAFINGSFVCPIHNPHQETPGSPHICSERLPGIFFNSICTDRYIFGISFFVSCESRFHVSFLSLKKEIWSLFTCHILLQYSYKGKLQLCPDPLLLCD